MGVKQYPSMPSHENMSEFEVAWNADPNKVLIRGMITQEAADFLESEAFKDFGMMKKGAIGMELTKLLLIAKECIENKKLE